MSGRAPNGVSPTNQRPNLSASSSHYPLGPAGGYVRKSPEHMALPQPAGLPQPMASLQVVASPPPKGSPQPALLTSASPQPMGSAQLMGSPRPSEIHGITIAHC